MDFAKIELHRPAPGSETGHLVALEVEGDGFFGRGRRPEGRSVDGAQVAGFSADRLQQRVSRYMPGNFSWGVFLLGNFIVLGAVVLRCWKWRE